MKDMHLGSLNGYMIQQMIQRSKDPEVHKPERFLEPKSGSRAVAT